ncbi:extracellular solute-binding protein [Paenibacillus sp. J5C_2022]|uniref:extracellular solute-binding protein n=1 Tax=Paenibacillus sp. J5C2022 TaxID=2977129 RepID=UPI0021D1A9FF|nr:extracellular solute-binding protein [Paenibacillus sp. J5C2022]MCU6709495.1 extracellular solute-binding protein [Paenibacillus sp. J5C2022]
MSPRKYVPLIVVVLLLSSLLLIPYSRSIQSSLPSPPQGYEAFSGFDGPLPDKPVVELHASVSVTAEQFLELQRRNRTFMADHPHIVVHLTNEPDFSSAHDNWERNSSVGDGADMLLLHNEWVMPFAVRGFLKPVDSKLANEGLPQHASGWLEPLKWNGYLWGVPYDINPYALLWNKSMLAEAGMSEEPQDWGSFLALVQLLSEGEEEATLLNLSPDDIEQLLVWLEKFRKDEEASAMKLEMTGEQQERLIWLSAQQERIGTLSLQQLNQIMQAIKEDRLLSLILPWHMYEGLDNAVKRSLIVDQKGFAHPWISGSSYVIGADCQAEQEAMQWIEAMVQQGGRSFPALAYMEEEQQLYKTDPGWPDRKRLLEGLWGRYARKEIAMDAFIAELAHPSGEGAARPE